MRVNRVISGLRIGTANAAVNHATAILMKNEESALF